VFVVDTNVLVYAADADSPLHETCRRRLNEWRSSPDAWYVTWGVLYEFLRVTTHTRVMRRPWSAPRAWQFVIELLGSRGLDLLLPTPRHAAVLAQIVEEVSGLSGNLLYDAHTAALMREHGIRRIYTRDTDFHRFRFLEPVDPTDTAAQEPRRVAARGARSRRPR